MVVRQLVPGLALRSALAAALVLGAASSARANGRPPGTSSITFQQGAEHNIAAGMTFGLVLSSDGGATWRWMCEDAIRYGGMYDPDYAYTASGAVFATTFGGLLVKRTGCEFDPTGFGETFMSKIALGPDGALYTAAVGVADPNATPPVLGDSKVYKSTDDGATFPIAPEPGMVGDWWSSIEVAPGDAQRIYLTGYRYVTGVKQYLLFRSTDGGQAFTPMATTGITTTSQSTIDVVGVSHTNADHVYARVTNQIDQAISDGIFRSTDGGQTWTRIFTVQDEIAFVVRRNGDLLVGTRSSGVHVSRAPSNGDAWEALTGAPHINCLVENAAGEVWACTQNYGGNQVLSDDAGIMKSTDLVTWTKVLRYQEIEGPVECPIGTLQRDQCVEKSVMGTTNWCVLRAQLGIEADPTTCPVAAPDAGVSPQDGAAPAPPGGCCDSSTSGGPLGLATTALVATVVLRRRRRTTTP